MYYETFFFKDRLFICHIFITQNKRRGSLCTDAPLTGYVDETSCKEKGREKEGPWCRLYYGTCGDQVNS